MVKYFPLLFKTKEEVKENRVSVMKRLEKEGSSEIHFATYTNDTSEPVAFASLLLKKDLTNIGILSGALTDENYRKRGIYSSLLFERIAYARKIGLQYLIVDAKPTTSGPILKKFNFKIIDQFEIYQLLIKRKMAIQKILLILSLKKMNRFIGQ